MQLPFYLVFLLSFPSFKRHFLGPCLFSLIFRNSYFHQCGSQCTFHYFLYKIYDPYPTTMSICMLLHQQKSSCQFFLQTLKYHQQRARKFTSLDMSPFKPPPPLSPFPKWPFWHLPVSLETIFSTCLPPDLSLPADHSVLSRSQSHSLNDEGVLPCSCSEGDWCLWGWLEEVLVLGMSLTQGLKEYLAAAHTKCWGESRTADGIHQLATPSPCRRASEMQIPLPPTPWPKGQGKATLKLPLHCGSPRFGP